jgi:hypothetical protein
MSHWWHTNTAIMEESLGDPCEQIRCYRTRRDHRSVAERLRDTSASVKAHGDH